MTRVPSAWLMLLLLASCRESTTAPDATPRLVNGVPPEHCQRVLRQSQSPGIGGVADGKMVAEEIPCGMPARCFDGNEKALAFMHPDGSVELRAGPHVWRGRTLRLPTESRIPGVLVGRRRALAGT